MPRRAKIALSGAGAGIALLALVWLAAFETGFGARADRSIFEGFAGLQRAHVNEFAKVIADSCDPKPFVALAAAIVLVALLRRRPRMALAVTALLVGANVTTELLKPALAAPRPLPAVAGPSFGSWPSGHATAAMSLALSAVLVAPARWRPAVSALGAVFAVAVSYSFLTLGWHYPSDVLGGFLIATVWALVVLAAVLTIYARRGRGLEAGGGRTVSLRGVLKPPALTLAGAGAVVALIALARPHQVIVYAHAHRAFVLGATAIAALGLTLATAVMLNVER